MEMVFPLFACTEITYLQHKGEQLDTFSKIVKSRMLA